VHQYQLLADIQAALEELGPHPLQLCIAFEQRLQAGGILFPERMPQRNGLIGRGEFTVRRGLRFAGKAPRQFGMQMGDLVAHDLGDGRALAGREIRHRQRAQLPEDGVVQRVDAGDHQRLRPALGAVRVRESERRSIPRRRDAGAGRQHRSGRVLRHGLAVVGVEMSVMARQGLSGQHGGAPRTGLPLSDVQQAFCRSMSVECAMKGPRGL
jgi:hypothetical protein